jgi:hypothetical protein
LNARLLTALINGRPDFMQSRFNAARIAERCLIAIGPRIAFDRVVGACYWRDRKAAVTCHAVFENHHLNDGGLL